MIRVLLAALGVATAITGGIAIIALTMIYAEAYFGFLVGGLPQYL